MIGKTTMQVNQATACEAFQLWADKHFKTQMKVTSVKLHNAGGAYDGASLFELAVEPEKNA
jgi:hypothetical protein